MPIEKMKHAPLQAFCFFKMASGGAIVTFFVLKRSPYLRFSLIALKGRK
jgi:hypothetical protein